MTVMPQSKDTECSYVQEVIIRMESENLTLVQAPVEFRKQGLNSRLIASLFGYATSAGKTIARSFRDYHPIRVFTWIGIILILVGLTVGFGVLTHYFETGMVTPHLPSAVLTTVLVIVGLQAIVFGLLADMMKTQRMLSEEILYRLKR